MNLKRIFQSITLLAVILIVSQSCGQTESSKSAESGTMAGVTHYRLLQFSETPWDLERGTHSLSAKEAETVNNYKFTHDEQGRLVSVEYCRGDETLTYGSLQAPKITFTYEGNKQIKKFFNKEGEQISSGEVYNQVFTLDDTGFRTAMHFFDKEGNPVENRNNIHRYEWSKMEDGLVKELRYNLADVETVMNPFCPFFELRFTYDNNGFVTLMANYEEDTLYDCTAENCGDIGVCFFEFKNNEHGDLLHFSVHNTVGQLSNLFSGWAKRVNKVDENGYLVEMEVYDQDDEPVSGNSIPVLAYSYNDHGALVEVRNLNTSKELMDHPSSGVAITRHSYDDKGNRVETNRFDKNNVAVVSE